jgi:SAM-dependent methyltransferase
MVDRCSICGVKQRRFLAYNGRPHARCPRCKSLERHRAVFATCKRLEIFTRFPAQAELLMISMDLSYHKQLAKHFKVTAITLEKQKGTVRADICSSPFDAGQFSVVTQAHMMEHVKDDRKATSEIFRLMSPGGIYISNVPCRGEETVEFDKVGKTHGHWRLYGTEGYKQLLADCGFVRIQRAGATFVAEKD